MRSVKSENWNKLDNAAKIFPPTSNERDTKVFRFSCQLKEPVDGLLLQQALDDVIGKFPIFCSVLKRGMFWYYLEHRETRPLVLPEHRPPCSELYDRNRKNLLFEVTHFRRKSIMPCRMGQGHCNSCAHWSVAIYLWRIRKSQEIRFLNWIMMPPPLKRGRTVFSNTMTRKRK